MNDKQLVRATDAAIREENRRAEKGLPSLASTDPLLADFFNMTLEEAGITLP